ncbi:LptF/LptG family permease [Lutimonas saemankumensis]|uniref:LptF/LptG family permease n=1 Tax=Lutimonas saemankumensis TaxID=483016 RepID=UPI001CD5F4EF|nr:LptF/LptG family permease [Lutimonas saemankumensis]MCA0931471.1 LptF/LptG family permease [Lutimonas saemankumensis]
MKILDRYILRKYFTSFIFTLLILIPIAMAIDVAEKVGKFLKAEDLTVQEIINDYYVNFIINYGNTFMPLALFISVIMFTSKLSNNSEIIAIHSSGVSFKRFLQPYLIGATIITVISLYTNHFIVPDSNKTLEKFEEDYLRSIYKKKTKSSVSKVSLQLSQDDYVYFGYFNFKSKNGYNFSYEHFDGNKLVYKIISQNIRWNDQDSTYRLSTYRKRFVGEHKDSLDNGSFMDTVFNFTPKDLLYVDYLAREMPSQSLSRHIKQSENRGVKNLNNYKVELYKRTSLPISSFVLTLIAVTLASKKRRGGIGFNLAAGISLMFLYVFFMKVSEVLGSTAESIPLLMVWIPNIIFGIIAAILYFNANK